MVSSPLPSPNQNMVKDKEFVIKAVELEVHGTLDIEKIRKYDIRP